MGKIPVGKKVELTSMRQALQFLRRAARSRRIDVSTIPTHIQGKRVAFDSSQREKYELRTLDLDRHPHVVKLAVIRGEGLINSGQKPIAKGRKLALDEIFMAVVRELHTRNPPLGNIFHTAVSRRTREPNLAPSRQPFRVSRLSNGWIVKPTRGRYLTVARTSIASLWRVLKEHQNLKREMRGLH